MTALLDAALAYHADGWTILPCFPGTKETRVKWEQYITERPGEEQIRRWWTQWPDANIAAVTGKEFVVVDIDSYKKKTDPRAWFAKAPTERIARSARGGWHLYYRKPSFDFPSRVFNEIGVDIRGGSGIIILPPSRFEGKPYSWVRQGEMGEMPAGLFREAEANSRTNDPHWIRELWDGVDEGGRDDASAKLAGYLAGKGIPKDVALGMLLSWDKKNKPPLGDRDINKTVDSVYRGAARRATRGGTVFASSDERQRHERPFSLVSMWDFVARFGDQAQEWLIDDWLPEATLLMVLAPPGSYKTWLVYDLAVSVATGTRFLDRHEVKKTGSVLLVQQEDSLPSIAGRLAVVAASKLGLRHDDDPESDVFTMPRVPALPISIHQERMLHFDDDVVMRDFEAAIATVRPRVVILDPLYSMASVEDFMVHIGENMLRLKSIRDRYHCSFILVHHAKKQGDGSRQDAWGSTFVNASREGGWQITKPDEIGDPTTISLRRHFKDGAEYPPLGLSFMIDGDRYEVTTMDEEPLAPDRVLAALDEKAMTEDALCEELDESRGRISTALAGLSGDGLIEKSRGRWRLTRSLPGD